MSTLGIRPQSPEEITAALKAAKGQNVLILFKEFEKSVEDNYVFGLVERVNDTECRVRVWHGKELTDKIVAIKLEKIFRVKREIGKISDRLLTGREVFQLVFTGGKSGTMYFGKVTNPLKGRHVTASEEESELAFVVDWTGSCGFFGVDVPLTEIESSAEVVFLPEELEKE